MATKKYRCFKECFAYNKRFKAGEMFPLLWIDNGYTPPVEYFVPDDEYDDFIRTKGNAVRTVYSAADDPRPTALLIEALARFMEIPKDWNRKRIWMALKQREMAELKTEPRRPGRPPKE